MLDIPMVALVGVLGLLVLSQVGLWSILLQVVKQQGRILLRLDELAQPRDLINRHVAESELLPIVAAPAEAPGLVAGSQLDDFLLPDLAGQLRGPKEWRGRRTLLIHWSTRCGFCDLIARDLAQLEASLEQAGVRLVLVSSGESEANRRLAEEFGLTCTILLQPDAHPIDAFNMLGTPVGYVLDETGRVAEPLAVGAEMVLEVARRLAKRAPRRLPGERSLDQSRIERQGLKAGTSAPLFTLQEVQGGTVSLESYRGRRVLLVFTDPHCGPCDALAPDLVRLARQGAVSGLEVLVIGRGDPLENRHKAEQLQLSFPVVLQERWEISKAYGIFATPVAFLINKHGVITHDVAMGPAAITALAETAMAVGIR
jgi:peroxiredoxin